MAAEAKFEVGDVIRMKKPHPCGSSEWEESVPVYGCYTFMTESQKDLFHTPVPISNLSATFSSKMYFWPIKHDELKRNKRLTQNPGWTYND